jgi:hypothetical protein
LLIYQKIALHYSHICEHYIPYYITIFFHTWQMDGHIYCQFESNENLKNQTLNSNYTQNCIHFNIPINANLLYPITLQTLTYTQ